MQSNNVAATIRQTLASGREKTSPYVPIAKRYGRSTASWVFHYLMLFGLAFVFIYPMLYLISKSLMQSSDLSDASVQWIPKALNFSNFKYAWEALDYLPKFKNSIITSLVPALVQIASCAFIGYGFARYRFPGYMLLLGFLLFTFLVPPQTIILPLYIFYSDLHWMNTYFPFVIPAVFGHGLRGALFVMIFLQFFRGLPGQLEEAARIDGAGALRTFWSIMFPLARPAMLVVFLFSLVWHWNDTFEPSLFTTIADKFNLMQNLKVMDGQTQLQLQNGTAGVTGDLTGFVPTFANRVMAGSLLTILPMLILYLFTQRYFVESVERAGIAGE
jgi:ABC-type sugar transport system, permease component